jgi:hypothetical protein
MPKIHFLRFFGTISLLAVVNIIRPPEVKAVGLTPITDTPESLNIPFGAPPPSPLTTNGVPSLVFNGQYWNIFVSQVSGLRHEGGFAPLYYVQQDSSGRTDESNGVFNPDLPTGVFWYAIRSFSGPYDAPPLEFSYLSNAPGGTFNNVRCPYVFDNPNPDCVDYSGTYSSVTCVKGSPGCVFYTFNRNFPIEFADSSGQLIADYQPLESSENVPEPLTIVGSVLALGLGKRFLSKTSAERKPAKCQNL